MVGKESMVTFGSVCHLNLSIFTVFEAGIERGKSSVEIGMGRVELLKKYHIIE